MFCNIQDAGYETKKSTIRGGWDKCLGPFDHYQAKAFGIDVWDCHNNNCYIRKDYNGGRYAADYCSYIFYRIEVNKLGLLGYPHMTSIPISALQKPVV